MKLKYYLSFVFMVLCSPLFSQKTIPARPGSTPPKLPMNIPPPPSFSSLSNKSGKYQLVSAEYYSQDPKPYLYKRLIKFDTSTGQAWILFSKIGANGEQRTWIPLETSGPK